MMRPTLIWQAWRQVGLLLHQVLVWNKSRIVLSRSHYCWNYEPIAYGWCEGRGRKRHGGHRPTRQQSGRSPRRSRTAPPDHPTCKPVELIRRPIDYHTKPGGLHLRALLRLGHGHHRRRADRPASATPSSISPGLLSTWRWQRWEAFTGKKAVVMARSTKAELERRLAEVAPLVCDCMTLREVRAWVNAKTELGTVGL